MPIPNNKQYSTVTPCQVTFTKYVTEYIIVQFLPGVVGAVGGGRGGGNSAALLFVGMYMSVPFFLTVLGRPTGIVTDHGASEAVRLGVPCARTVTPPILSFS